jgi:hypothetical protein
MSEEISRGRSPSCPQIPLLKAIEMVKNLHAKAGKAAISRETAVGPMGFNGMNGAALTALSVLSQYGLIDAERGANLRVSDLALRIIHPTGAKQEADAKAEAVMRPKVFAELYQGGYGDCDEGVLANHLVQSGFTPDGARKVAAVFKANSEFANLSGGSTIPQSNEPAPPSHTGDVTADYLAAIRRKPKDAPKTLLHEPATQPGAAPQGRPENTATAPAITQRGNVLAQYSIPLGENVATLVFTGSRLTADDFDALEEYVGLFKKQFIRAQAAAKADFATPIIEEVPPSREVRDDMTTFHGIPPKE